MEDSKGRKQLVLNETATALFEKTKKQISEEIGIQLNNSQFIEILCGRFLKP